MLHKNDSSGITLDVLLLILCVSDSCQRQNERNIKGCTNAHISWKYECSQSSTVTIWKDVYSLIYCCVIWGWKNDLYTEHSSLVPVVKTLLVPKKLSEKVFCCYCKCYYTSAWFCIWNIKPSFELYIPSFILWTKFVITALCLSQGKWVSRALLLSCLRILWGLVTDLGRSCV